MRPRARRRGFERPGRRRVRPNLALICVASSSSALAQVWSELPDGFAAESAAGPVRRSARVAVMLALAHHLRSAIDDGRVRSQADAAVRLGYTPARMSQLLDLLRLAPDLQERVLLLEAVDGVQPLPERMLRPIVHLVNWIEQRAAFEALGTIPVCQSGYQFEMSGLRSALPCAR